MHRRDARAKTFCTLVFLVLISTAPVGAVRLYAAGLALLVFAILLAGLPLAAVLARAALVIPLSLTFAVLVAIEGDTGKAAALVVRTYLSAMAALLLVGTTPLPKLLDGLYRMGVPKMIILTAQFLHRYLFILAEQSQHMRIAAASRAAGRTSRRLGLRSAAGRVAILFARSYDRAEGIYRSMLARGFQGEFRLLEPARFSVPDAVASGCFLLLCMLLRWSLVT